MWHWACTHFQKRWLFRQRQLNHRGLGEGDYRTPSHTAEPYSCLQVWVFSLEHSNHLKLDFSRVLQRYLKGVSSVFQGCFKFQVCFKEVFKGVRHKKKMRTLPLAEFQCSIFPPTNSSYMSRGLLKNIVLYLIMTYDIYAYKKMTFYGAGAFDNFLTKMIKLFRIFRLKKRFSTAIQVIHKSIKFPVSIL